LGLSGHFLGLSTHSWACLQPHCEGTFLWFALRNLLLLKPPVSIHEIFSWWTKNSLAWTQSRRCSNTRREAQCPSHSLTVTKGETPIKRLAQGLGVQLSGTACAWGVFNPQHQKQKQREREEVRAECPVEPTQPKESLRGKKWLLF
jgi:hypothetical protein